MIAEEFMQLQTIGVICNNCTMGKSGLPDIIDARYEFCWPEGYGCIYQTNFECQKMYLLVIGYRPMYVTKNTVQRELVGWKNLWIWQITINLPEFLQPNTLFDIK